MDIIRKGNILDQKDLLLFENHRLDKVYELENMRSCRKITKLMLLINLLNKYPTDKINNIIKKYVEEVPNEINNINERNDNALILCACNNFIEAMRILLNNGIDINTKGEYNWTAAHYAAFYENLSAIKLLIEYDANMGLKSKNNNAPPSLFNSKNKVSKMMCDVAILNIKN